MKRILTLTLGLPLLLSRFAFAEDLTSSKQSSAIATLLSTSNVGASAFWTDHMNFSALTRPDIDAHDSKLADEETLERLVDRIDRLEKEIRHLREDNARLRNELEKETHERQEHDKESDKREYQLEDDLEHDRESIEWLKQPNCGLPPLTMETWNSSNAAAILKMEMEFWKGQGKPRTRPGMPEYPDHDFTKWFFQT